VFGGCPWKSPEGKLGLPHAASGAWPAAPPREGRLRRVELTKGHPSLRLPRGDFCGWTSAPVNGCLNPGFMTIQLDSLSTPVRLDNTPTLFIAPTLTPFHSHEADLQVRCYRSPEGRLHARKGSRYWSCNTQWYDPAFQLQPQEVCP